MNDGKNDGGLSRKEREHLACVGIMMAGCALVWFGLGPALVNLWRWWLPF